MDILLVTLAVVVGGLIGLVVSDMATRTRLKNELEASRKDLDHALKVMSEANNSMAQKIMDLSDRVQGHELKLSAGVQQPNNPFAPRR